MPSDPPAPRDESALCLACGLCCAGAFYDLVPLDPDELDHARKLRLPLFDREPLLTFRLPCPRLDGTACTVYAERPAGTEQQAGKQSDERFHADPTRWRST